MSPKKRMTRDEVHDFYSRLENHEPKARLGAVVRCLRDGVPVRFRRRPLLRSIAARTRTTGCRVGSAGRLTTSSSSRPGRRELVKQLVKRTTTDGPGRRRTARR